MMFSKRAKMILIFAAGFILSVLLGLGYRASSAHPYIAIARLSSANPALSDIELSGHVLGAVEALSARGNYLAVVSNKGFGLVNIADPDYLRSTSFLLLPGGFQRAVYLDSQYAYITWGVADIGTGGAQGGLQIVDISDPTAPFLVGSLEGGILQGIAKKNNYVFAETSTGANVVIDVSDPTKPVEVGLLGDDVGRPSSLEERSGGTWLLYGVNGYSLSVTDISTPTAPQPLATYQHPQGMIMDTAVYTENLTGKSYLYLANYAYHDDVEVGGLQVVDVTNPSSPISVTLVDETTNYYQVEISGGYLCASSEQALHVFDISDPAAPQEVGIYEGYRNIYALASQGNYIYVSDYELGLQIVNISVPSSPILQGVQANAVAGGDARVVGNYAYIPTSYGLQIVDLLNPASPKLFGAFGIPDGAGTVAVTGNYALVGKKTGIDDNVFLIDISAPSVPVVMSVASTGQTVSDILIKEDSVSATEKRHAYIGSMFCDPAPLPCVGTLDTFDISEPMTPTRVNRYELNGAIRKIAMDADQRLFAALSHAGPSFSHYVAMFDIASITPTLVTTTTIAGSVTDMSIQGDYAYVATWEGLEVVAITGTTTLERVGQYQYSTEGLPTEQSGIAHIAVDGERAYLADEYNGILVVLDISLPAQPTEVGRISMPGGGNGLTLSNGYLYAANGSGGLSIYHYLPNTGNITDVNGRPFSGVIVDANGQAVTASGLTGSYALTDLPAGAYTLIPEMKHYAFWPPKRVVSLSENVRGQNFVILPPSVSTELSTSQVTTLVYTDTEGLLTRFEFPAVITPGASIMLTPTIATDSLNLGFTGHAFNLSAYQNASPLDEPFSSPVTVTIQYSSANVRLISSDNELTLYWWNGNTWVDAVTTCASQVNTQRDLGNKTIQTAFCKTGSYALFGPTNRLFLPFIK